MKNAVILLAIILTSCGSVKTRSTPPSGENQPLVDEKFSLKSDRQALDELRKDIPPEKKQANDETSFMQSFFVDLNKDPSDIRENFGDIMRKKREKFDSELKKDREKFSKEEKDGRDRFLKEAGSEREDFLSSKHTSDERKKFFDEQEDKRKDFFSNQREKRDEFEEVNREKRKNFEDYSRGKTNEFNSLLREFTKKREEDKKQKEALKKENLKSLNQELDEVRKKQGVTLEGGE